MASIRVATFDIYMSYISSYLRYALLCLVLVLSTSSAFASHIVGVDLFYTWVSGNTYKITLMVYGDCGPSSSGAFSTLSFAAPQICIFNGDTLMGNTTLSIQTPTAGVEITPVCAADVSLTQCTDPANSIPGIKKFVYSGNYTLPYASSVWRFMYMGYMGSAAAGSGRAAAITNINSGSIIQVVDTLDNTVYHNSNPALTVVPTPFFCLNSSDNYNPGAVDPDGDSLSFALVPGMGTAAGGSTTCVPTGAVTYISPYTATAPLAASSFTFDSHTGQISFYPNALQRSLVVYNVREYRGGHLVGTSQREMTFLVLTCTNVAASGALTAPTAGTVDDSAHYHICQNSGAFSVSINPTEPASSNLITVTWAGLPAGATFAVTGNGTATPHCTFLWTSTGVAPGSYTFYVTYTDNNCPLAGVTTLAYTITISALPAVSAVVVSPATCTQKGLVSITPTGGGSPWLIKISRPVTPYDTLQSFPGVAAAFNDSLSPGTYNITIYASGRACKATATVNIAAPTGPTPTATSTNPSYCGATDGVITLYHLYPGTADTIRYYYNGVLQPALIRTVAADSTITLNGMPGGTYSAMTISYGLCTSSALPTITLTNPAFTMRAIDFTNPSYCGVCNGSIRLYGLHPGQLDTLNYTRNGVAQAPVVVTVAADSMITLTGLCTGTYASFIARTAGTCVSNTLGPVVLTAPFTMRAITYTNPDYCGICNGKIKLWGLYPGQTDTISYTKDGIAQTPVVATIGADSTVTISALCAGTYASFIAKTAGVCVSNTLGPVTLTIPAFTMRAITYTNPDYCGICNGVIKLWGLHPGQTDTVTYTKDGVAQSYAQLVGSDSTITISGLCFGTYDNFVAHTAGVCVSNTLGPVTLMVPPFTMRKLTYTNPDYCGICNGTIKIWGLHPGQTDTITYTKDGVAQSYAHAVGSDSTITISGLCFGTYDNFVAHTGGVCASNTLGPVTLTVPPFSMRTITYTNPDYCGICNGTIKLWGLHPGQLDTITYMKDGVAQTPVVVTIPADSTVTITGLCFGTYSNFIAHTAGVCISNTLGPVTLTVPPFTMRALTFTNPDYCGICNGTIKLWGLYPGQLDAITYTKDGVAQTPVVVTIPADSTVTITSLCFGLYDNFIAHTGGLCVSNTLGPANLTVPPFTMRAITYTNPDYCGICNGTIKLWGIHPGQLDTITYTKDGVAQTPIVVTIPADSTVTLTNLCFGTYDNFIAHTGGVCLSNTLGPVTLTVPPFTVRAVTFTNPTKCGFCDGKLRIWGAHPDQNDTVYYDFNGVAQTPVPYFVGSDSTINLSGLCEGTYANITVRTGGVCVSNVLGPVTLVAPPIIPGFTMDLHKHCDGDTLYLTNTSAPASDLTYTWDFGDSTGSTATNPVHVYTAPGTYTITLHITNTRCVDSTQQNVEVDNLVVAGMSQAPDSFICVNKPVSFTNLSAGTALHYLWIYGDGTTDTATAPTHIYSLSGVYNIMLVVSNEMPCYDTVTHIFDVDSISTVSIGVTDSVLCNGTGVTFTGVYAEMGSTGLIWTFGDGSAMTNLNPASHSYDHDSFYTVTLEVLYRACPDTSTSRVISVFSHPNINLGADTSICAGSEPLMLADLINQGNPNARWVWSTGATTSSILVTEPGYYSATVSLGGCWTSDTVWVKNDCYLDVPNAFTPNGDGVNDYFLPRDILARGLTSFRMSIFNRWGQVIFETDKTEGRGWDGEFNGQTQPEGVYIYVIEATFRDGQKEHRQGNLTLLR